MHCININHPDYKFLLENSGQSPVALKAKISIWMNKYGTDNFPTLSQLNLGTDLMYQTPNGRAFAEQAKRIFFDDVYGKDPKTLNVEIINKKLQQISSRIGDVPWNLRMSRKGNYYIAGYKNMPVTMDDYFSPYAQGFFRQLRSQSTEGKIEKLDKKLLSWARKHGISVEAMKSVMEKFPNRYEKSALGVADFAKNLIAIADGAKIDTMAEEVAHFAVEMLVEQKNSNILNAINKVSETNTYSEVQREYKGIYKKEIDFRKEALGKLIAAEIVTQFQLTEKMASRSGLWQGIKKAITDFFNFIGSKLRKKTAARIELNSAIVPLAKSILAEESLGKLGANKFTKKDIKYQKEETSKKNNIPDSSISAKEKFLTDAVKNLESRIDALQTSNKGDLVNKLKREIKSLTEQIEKQQLDLGIASFVSLAEKEIDALLETMNNSIDNGTPISENNMELIRGFNEMYNGLFTGITADFINAGLSKEEREELSTNFDNVGSKLNRSISLAFKITDDQSINTAEAGNTDAYGNKIDPNQDSEELVKTANYDRVNVWRFNAGNFKYADSVAITTALKLINDQVGKVKRFAVRLANNILKSQESFMLKYKQEDLVEKDSNGKLTHNFIRKYNMTEYYGKLNEVKKEIAEELGYENEKGEISYAAIPFDQLSSEERKYKKERLARFFKENSKITYEQEESGNVIEVRVPNDTYLNKDFERLMADPVFKNHYDLIIKTKLEALQLLPTKYRTERNLYLLPGVMKSFLDTLSNRDISVMKRLGQLTEKAFFVDADDTQFGQLNLLNNKMVPIHFTGKIDDLSTLSYDIGRTIVLFAEMAKNFQEMSSIAGKMQGLQSTLGRREYIDKGVKKTSTETREYKALEHLIDTNLFGIERDAIGVEITTDSKIGKAIPSLVGKEFSWTKFSQAIAGWIRNNNLAFNFVSSTAGWFKGSIDKFIEEHTGLYTNHDSALYAKKEFLENIGQILSQTGKIKQTNKLHLILQENEVAKLDVMLYETGKSRAARKLLTKDIAYTTFSVADYGIKGRTAIGIYDNHRLYKGQYLTRAQYLAKTASEQNVKNDGVHEKNMKEDWKNLREKSLYNSYEVVDGILQVKKEFQPYVTEALLNSVRGKIQHVASTLDGVLGNIDKGALSRQILGDFLLMHRGWVVQLIDTRFRKQSYNKLSGEEELGNYRASLGYLKDIFVNDQGFGFAPFAAYSKLNSVRKRGVIKSVMDLGFLVVASIMAAAVNLKADEEPDDWMMQLMAYQMNRILLEQNAAWSIGEFVEMVDEPIAGSRHFKEWADIWGYFSNEEIERGMYKGKSKWQKKWMKFTPIKNLYELQYPDEKNKFIKTVVKSALYENLSDDDKMGLTDIFFNWLLPYNDANYWENLSQDERDDILSDLIDEAAQEQNGEYNRFNG